MKFRTKVVEVDLEKIVKYSTTNTPAEWEVETETGRKHIVVSGPEVETDDYLNVTNSADIYHIPAAVVAQKYEEII